MSRQIPNELIDTINNYSSNKKWYGFKSTNYDCLYNGWFIYTELKYAIKDLNYMNGKIAIITQHQPKPTDYDSEKWGSWMTLETFFDIRVMCKKYKKNILIHRDHLSLRTPLEEKFPDCDISVSYDGLL